MPESVSKTVTETAQKVNNNMVKIALDEYNELVRKASRPVVNNVTYLQKTAKQAAMDNEMYGAVLAGGGIVFTLIGLAIFRHGKRHLKP